jgi:hypothetical protein
MMVCKTAVEAKMDIGACRAHLLASLENVMTVDKQKNRERLFLRHGVDGAIRFKDIIESFARNPPGTAESGRAPVGPALARRQQARRPMSWGRLPAYYKTDGVRPPKETA